MTGTMADSICSFDLGAADWLYGDDNECGVPGDPGVPGVPGVPGESRLPGGDDARPNGLPTSSRETEETGLVRKE